MPRYLIEVSHANTKEACDQAIQAFLRSGSHFVTNADWGCSDDVHKAWFVAELESKDQALQLLPSHFRQHATVIGLERFDLDGMLKTAEAHSK
jgi:hypothetical protein